MQLRDSIENASFALQPLVTDLIAGKLPKAREIHALCTYFRMRGVCRMLTEGTVDGLHLNQMQDAGAYLHWLRSADDKDKVTSWAQPFFAAVAAGFWDAAAAIAQVSRLSCNRRLEHEDDFLFIAFLMQRYFIGGSAEMQRQMLDDYERVLEGAADPRLSVCRALYGRDGQAFEEALIELLEARRARIAAQLREGKLTEAHAEWALPFAPEGLALLRFGEKEGLSAAPVFMSIPAIARPESRRPWLSSAWTVLDYNG